MSPRETNERDMDGGRAGTMERMGGWVGGSRPEECLEGISETGGG